MTRTTLRRGGLAVGVCLTVGLLPARGGEYGKWGCTAVGPCERAPQPAGLLRSCACFGYFPTQWQPWQMACPIPQPGALMVAPVPVTESTTLPPPQPAPPAPPPPGPMPPPAPLAPLVPPAGGR
ncbi:MAG TPA: hypothetical protein VGF55_27680 [Gemmataceae bacterium]|jgi:hypothetical protein